MNKIYFFNRKEFKVSILSILFWIVIPILYTKFYTFVDINTHDWSNLSVILFAPILGFGATIFNIIFCVKNLRTLYQENKPILGEWFLFFLLYMMFFMPYIGTKIGLTFFAF